MAAPQGANVAGDCPQLALLTLAQCRKRGGGDASSSRSLCKALADRLPYWQRGGLELLNRLHNASSGPGVHVDARMATRYQSQVGWDCIPLTLRQVFAYCR